MSVVIDQVETEVGGSAPAPHSADSAPAAPTATQAPDLNRLEFHMGRLRQRAQRLWAD